MPSRKAPCVFSIKMASSKESRKITVEFTDVSGATSYILRAETNDGSFLSEIPVPSSPGTVTNLQPYTDYTLSVMSVNSAGRSQPSISVEAKTVLPAPQFNTSSPSNSSILVKWEPVNHAVLYSLSISKEGSYSQSQFNTTDTQFVFQDLEAGTSYCIKGNAWSPENIAGDDFRICQITRPPTPQSVALVVTSTPDAGIVVSWDSAKGAEQYVALSLSGQNCSSSSNSCILIPLNFIKSDDGIEGTCNSTEPRCQFHCSCGYSYIMSVFAHNHAGASPPGPLVNHTTD